MNFEEPFRFMDFVQYDAQLRTVGRWMFHKISCIHWPWISISFADLWLFMNVCEYRILHQKKAPANIGELYNFYSRYILISICDVSINICDVTFTCCTSELKSRNGLGLGTIFIKKWHPMYSRAGSQLHHHFEYNASVLHDNTMDFTFSPETTVQATRKCNYVQFNFNDCNIR